MYATLNLLWVLGLVAFMAIEWRSRRCTCGRTKPWYFHAGNHVRARWNYIFAAYLAVRTVLMLVRIDWYAVIEVLLLTYFTRWLWFHEKDKIKRAARALGRVTLNRHGRLVVSNAE